MHWIISRMTRACVCVTGQKTKKNGLIVVSSSKLSLYIQPFFPPTHLKKLLQRQRRALKSPPFLKEGVAHNFFQPKYTTLFLHQDLGSFFFFGLETPIFQVIFKKVLKRLPSSAALMTVQFIGSSTLDACQDGATQYYSTLKVSSIR